MLFVKLETIHIVNKLFNQQLDSILKVLKSTEEYLEKMIEMKLENLLENRML